MVNVGFLTLPFTWVEIWKFFAAEFLAWVTCGAALVYVYIFADNQFWIDSVWLDLLQVSLDRLCIGLAWLCIGSVSSTCRTCLVYYLVATQDITFKWWDQIMYKVLRGSLLSVYAAIILVPCMIVITGAFKTDFEIYTKPLSLPATWSFDNFRKLFVESNIARPFLNSVTVAC